MAGVKGKYNAKNVENLKNVLLGFLNQLDTFGFIMAKEGAKLDLAQLTFNRLLNRTELNIEGIVAILDIYKSQPAMIHPIAHILRTLLVDFLNFCYLMTFYNKEEDGLISFSNELDHFDRDFLKSAFELAEVEFDLPKNNPKFRERPPHQLQEKLKSFQESYKHLFKTENSSLKPKLSKELRANSNRDMFLSNEEFGNPGKGMLSESYKYRRLIDNGFGKYADVYLLYKYFSQQYHFSNISNNLLNPNNADHNFFYLIWAINHVFLVTDMQIQLLDGKDSAFLEPLRKLEIELGNSLI